MATEWYTPALEAVTLGGKAKFNIRALESNAAASASLRAEIAVCNGDGTGAVVWGSACVEPITTYGAPGELNTADTAAVAWVSGDDLAVAAGQRLRFRIYVEDSASAPLVTGHTVTVSYNGASAVAAGDTYVTLPVAVTEQATGPTNQNVSASGLVSAQNFGAVTTLKGAVSRAVTGLGSAQGFGTVTPKAVVTRAVTGIGSAQAFGAATPKATITKIVGGVASAQAFGTTTPVPRTTVPVGALASSQSFGTPTAVIAGPPQTVVVPGVYPPGYVDLPSIVGTFLVGDGHVVGGGSSTAAQFGVPRVVAIQIVPVVGISSPQAFGTVTPKAIVTRAVTGLGSAQVFGTAIPRAIFVLTATGLASAQAFGAVTPKAVITKIVGGVASAQAFGTTTPVPKATVPAGGLSSAQSFGAVTIRTAVTRIVGGVSSAQAFGAISVGGVSAVAVTGIPSAQAFGAVGIYAIYPKLRPVGLGSAQSFGSVTIAAAITRAVGAVSSAQAFGTPSFGTGFPPQTATGSGVPSAQSFGAVTLRTAVTVAVQGISRAAGFDPDTIPGLSVWLDASQLALADGAALTVWPDLSDGNHSLFPATGPNAPTFKTNILNGLPVVRFDGIDDVLVVTNVVAAAYQHFFVVAKFRLNAFPDYCGLLSNNSGHILIGTAGATNFYPPPQAYEYRRGGVVDASRQGPMQVWEHMGLSFTAPLPADYFKLGLDRVYPPRYWDGDVAEVVVFDRKLSDAERLQVEEYLNGKWIAGTGGGGETLFGTVIAKSITPVSVNGVGSAQSFGTITTAVKVPVTGLGSAQQFGTPTTRSVTRINVNGVLSAQSFGTARAGQIVQVSGLNHGVVVFHIVGTKLAGQANVGWTGEYLFGRPGFWLRYPIPGLGSAQAFGTPFGRGGPWTVAAGGVGSAQRFGQPFVYRAYLKPPIELDLILVPTTPADLMLTATGGHEVTISPSLASGLVLEPSDEEELALVPSVEE